MIIKGDLFIVKSKQGDGSYNGVVFKCNGMQGNVVYAEVVGRAEGSYFSVGHSAVIGLDRWEIEEPNDDTLDAAGLKRPSRSQTKDTLTKDTLKELLANLEAEAEAAKLNFCDELVKQTVKLAKRKDHLLVESALCLDEAADSLVGGFQTEVVAAAKKYIDAVSKIEAAKIVTK